MARFDRYIGARLAESKAARSVLAPGVGTQASGSLQPSVLYPGPVSSSRVRPKPPGASNYATTSTSETVTACPASVTRLLLSRIRTVPPRADAWYPTRSSRPNRGAQYGASAQ